MVNGRNETILVFYEFGSSQETIALRFDRLLWLRDPRTKASWFRIVRFGPGPRQKKNSRTKSVQDQKSQKSDRYKIQISDRTTKILKISSQFGPIGPRNWIPALAQILELRDFVFVSLKKTYQ